MSGDKLGGEMKGKKVGGCEIIELIGVGGMGAVYLANQLALNKHVAIKILDAKWMSEQRHVESFLAEARLAAKLEDENIVGIYDVGTDGPYHYIVMQLARGETLKDRLKRGVPSVEEALGYIEGAARGLSVAHANRIAHRDIKPGNLMVGDDGRIKILDFGLAKLDRGDPADDGTSQFMGSVAYMSPEQSEYMRVDYRSDIYSLGCTAYQCLTGQIPFKGDNNWEMLVRHHCEEPTAPSQLRPEVPLTVSRVVLRMMAKDPADRYPNMDALLTDLKLLRRHQIPATAAPWQKRSLNPEPVDLLTIDCEDVYRKGLKVQRDAFKAGQPVRPLRDLLPGLGVIYRATHEPSLVPANFLTVSSNGSRWPLAVAAAKNFQPDNVSALSYADRFEITTKPERIAIKVKGRDPLGIAQTQRLYDLLEAMPQGKRAVAIALQPDYVAQGQDVRWVVDVFNLLDRARTPFSLVVGSMDNHSTFIRLGIDSHIRLELELERESTLTLGKLQPKEVPKVVNSDDTGIRAAAGTLPGLENLAAPAAKLVRTIAEKMRDGHAPEAVRTWRKLVTEGLDKQQMVALRPLKHELFEKVLAEGKEAYDQDDYATANDRFNLLIDLDPARHEGHFYKGLLLKEEGKLEYAQAFLTQAILAAPDDAELFYHRAIVRSRADDQDGALRDLNMALDHNPRHVASYFNRAKLHKKMGRDDLAQRDIKLYDKLKREEEKAGKKTS
ncbi:MAG: protein kinase [Planctomycetes bacterium]|nr:protein kinase [Planctomycetota bacterium]